ncbi:MAG: hypothetical protein MJZ60_08825 [Bacteroidaceae bacterium]|nr:hypothetical protein [Bacteroidaceae bacterium]
MQKIATHNSCTGEAGRGLLSKLLTPFARCQGKNIYEQFQSGCRLFDIRARLTRDGIYRPAHGLWTCRRTIIDILAQLNDMAGQDRMHPTYVMMTYEGKLDYTPSFTTVVHSWMSRFPNLTFTKVGLRKPWKTLEIVHEISFRYGFIPLNRQHWQMWLPIPRLWQLIYCPHPTFDDTTFKMVDFL